MSRNGAFTQFRSRVSMELRRGSSGLGKGKSSLTKRCLSPSGIRLIITEIVAHSLDRCRALAARIDGSCARKCPEHFDDALSLAEFHAPLEGAVGRSVHGLVKTVAGQRSRPVSIAARSLRQNSSSCFWRRARASTLPSSMTRFRFDMMPPQRYARR